MSEDQKKQLETQLWNIANELRGKMDADGFRDYILGFIFYKYLSEKMELHADKLLASENIKYQDLAKDSKDASKYIDAVRINTVDTLGYFLVRQYLPRTLAGAVPISALPKTSLVTACTSMS